MIVDAVTKAIRRVLVGREQEFAFTRTQDIYIPVLSQVGLYVHIPFCRSKCPYCPYYRVDYDENLAGPYTEAVLAEIEEYFSRLGRAEVTSLYIGGGTPTTLIDRLGVIIASIEQKSVISGDICVETSPADLNDGVVRKLQESGVNLLSIGVQSFDNRFLGLLGRNYDADQARAAAMAALSAGFRSVNMDLMFALPGQTTADVLNDLREALRLGANQVTAYPLFTFPYSSIGRYLRMRRVRTPRLFRLKHMYGEISSFLRRHGYQRVSVWGFKKGDSPRYSSVTRDIYVGVGAGAGSRLPDVFYFNTYSVSDYIAVASRGRLPIALAMDMTPELGKYYWLYWRLYETCLDSRQLQARFGSDAKLKAMLGLARLLGLARQDSNRIELTERGAFYIHLLQNWFILDYINRVWSAAMSEPWPSRVEF